MRHRLTGLQFVWQWRRIWYRSRMRWIGLVRMWMGRCRLLRQKLLGPLINDRIILGLGNRFWLNSGCWRLQRLKSRLRLTCGWLRLFWFRYRLFNLWRWCSFCRGGRRRCRRWWRVNETGIRWTGCPGIGKGRRPRRFCRCL